MEFLAEYGLFFLKVLTFVVAAVIIIAMASGSHTHTDDDGEIVVSSLNEQHKNTANTVEAVVLSEKHHKEKAKKDKKSAKKAAKNTADDKRPRVFVIEFEGDMRAKAAEQLRKEVTAILCIATSNDEVVIKLESPGGVVHGYGFAASQLQRIRAKNIPLTVCVDKVAASGGYMMSCIANKIIAAPFAMVGSIGVVAQIPNFHRMLKKHDVDYELHTAGEYKRTLTMFGENTDEGRAKFTEELELTHELFKHFVSEHRPQLDIDAIATGEVWFGSQALSNQLVDALGTSDEYLVEAVARANVFSVKYQTKKTWQHRLGFAAQNAIGNAVETAVSKLWEGRFR